MTRVNDAPGRRDTFNVSSRNVPLTLFPGTFTEYIEASQTGERRRTSSLMREYGRLVDSRYIREPLRSLRSMLSYFSVLASEMSALGSKVGHARDVFLRNLVLSTSFGSKTDDNMYRI